MSAPEVCIKVRAFLTMKPVGCTTGSGLDSERGLILAARDTSGLLVGGFSAQWLGTAAIRFLAQHHEELKPGRCLDLEIFHIKPANSELRARVKTCELAPLAPSWIKHEEKLNQSTEEKPSA